LAFDIWHLSLSEADQLTSDEHWVISGQCQMTNIKRQMTNEISRKTAASLID
jgi:hypothetical protein